MFEIIDTFEKIINKSIPFRILPRRNGDTSKVIANNQKAKLLLNWNIKNNLHDICKDTINWINQSNFGNKQ